jgi:hypothetical protein
MDGYSGYNQVKMVEKDQKKEAFISKWDAYAYKVMPFGLCNAPTTFQKVETKAFKEYLNKFMQEFLDNFSTYGSKKNHLSQLQKCLEECKRKQISLNPKKCAFYVNLGVLRGHIICSDGLLVDHRKIIVITTMLVPINVIEIKRF